MTTDLWMLFLTAGLSLALILVPTVLAITGNGLAWALGNRERTPEPTALLARAKRASANLQENLPMFAILVLVAHVSATADATSALGAQLFFGARVAHGLIYIGGVPGLRTLSYAVSLVGMGMIAAAIAF